MKTRIKILVLFFLLLGVTMIKSEKAEAQHFSITFQSFYDELSPYGTWMYRPDLGYAWLPNAGPGFFPYATNGYWLFTDFGWTWISLYPWGWAPFHYGRWYIDPYWGPMWIPGYEWSPAWVVWRSSRDYCGWAPMGPGMTLDIVFGGHYNLSPDYWRFVRYRDFGKPHIDRYYINHVTNVTIINHTTVINNVRVDRDRNVKYLAGPERHEFERNAGRVITPVELRDNTKPGQYLTDNKVELYRPRVEKSDVLGQGPAPRKVVNYEKMDSQKDQRPADRMKDTRPENRQQPPVKYEPRTGISHQQQPSKQEALPRSSHQQAPVKSEAGNGNTHQQPPAKTKALPGNSHQQPAKTDVRSGNSQQKQPVKSEVGTGRTDKPAMKPKTGNPDPGAGKQVPERDTRMKTNSK